MDLVAILDPLHPSEPANLNGANTVAVTGTAVGAADRSGAERRSPLEDTPSRNTPLPAVAAEVGGQQPSASGATVLAMQVERGVCCTL